MILSYWIEIQFEFYDNPERVLETDRKLEIRWD